MEKIGDQKRENGKRQDEGKEETRRKEKIRDRKRKNIDIDGGEEERYR